MKKIVERLNKKPLLGKNVFIARSAILLGDITIGDNVSIWYNVVVRADVNYITIGENTNIQDGTIVHVTKDKYPTEIGKNVTIGHSVTLHGCKIEENCLIGIGAVILDNSIISKNSLVAAGAVVPPNKTYSENSLIMGNPAKEIRKLSDSEIHTISENTKRYLAYKDIYLDMKID